MWKLKTIYWPAVVLGAVGLSDIQYSIMGEGSHICLCVIMGILCYSVDCHKDGVTFRELCSMDVAHLIFGVVRFSMSYIQNFTLYCP
jgi:hypothetical protein